MTSANDNINISGNQKNSEEIIKLLTEKVEELYAFRDLYFENHSVDTATEKDKLLEQQLNLVLQLMQDSQEHAVIGNKARFSYLKGRALNVMPTYSKEAYELLSKAVKLDPKLVEAWNELGECCWKTDNLKEAENCFNAALIHGKNKVALRNLSIIIRQKYSKLQEEKRKWIEEGLNLAKQAVQLDPNDGLSWVVLGNAHLCGFFGVLQSPKTLKQCLSAYAQAEKDVRARCNPDLHYNKAITLKYEEEFEAALDSFETAIQYEPMWEPPKIKSKQLIKYLQDIRDFANSSGKMKAKRLKQIIQSIDSKQLGPYGGGSYTSNTSGQTVRLNEISLTELKPGLNEEVVVLGKVVCSVYNEEGVPFTFCLVDKFGTCAAVSVFNIAESRGVIIGDSVGIPEPYVTDVNFKHKEEVFKFRLIRVETPCVMVVNGKKLGKESLAGVQMSLFKKST